MKLRAPAIIFSAIFHNKPWSASSNYFVIGSYPNSNLSFSENLVQYVGKALKGQQPLSGYFQPRHHDQDVIPDGDKAPHAILLLREKTSLPILL
jgi:hypothetical protein